METDVEIEVTGVVSWAVAKTGPLRVNRLITAAIRDMVKFRTLLPIAIVLYHT